MRLSAGYPTLQFSQSNVCKEKNMEKIKVVNGIVMQNGVIE